MKNQKVFEEYFRQLSEQLIEPSRQFQELSKTIADLSNLSGIQTFQRNIKDLQHHIISQNQRLYDNISSLSGRLNSIRLAQEQINKIQFQFNQGISTKLTENLIYKSNLFSKEITQPLKDYLKIVDELGRNEMYKELELRVEKLESGHSTKQGFQFTLQDILQILMILIMLLQYQDESIQEAINNLEEDQEKTNQILEGINFIVDNAGSLVQKIESDEYDLLIVKRDSILRTNPSAKSDSLINVFEGQFLDLIEDGNRWYKVQYFNFKDSTNGVGWVYKGNVNRPKN